MEHTGQEPTVATDQPRLALRPVRWVVAHSTWTVLLLAAGAATVSALAVLLNGDTVSFWDEEAYLQLASNLSSRNGFSFDGVTPTAYRPPGFPVFLSGFTLIDDSVTVVRLANALTYGVLVLLAGHVARRLFGPSAAVLAALGTTAAPVAVFTASKLYPQTLASILLLSSLAALLEVERSRSARNMAVWAALTGIGLSALTLTVPNHGITLVVGAVWLGWRMRRVAIAPLLIILVCFALPICAWTIRNYVELDEFVPLSTNGGVNLLLGNSEVTGPGDGTNADISEYRNAASQRGLNEVETDRFFRQVALEWITGHPADAATLYVLKLLNTFAVSEELATAEQQRSAPISVVIAARYLPLLSLFLLRPVLALRAPVRRGEGLLIGVFWANVLAGAIFFTRIRFRVPLDPLMVIIVAGLLATYLDRFLSTPATITGHRSSATVSREAG